MNLKRIAGLALIPTLSIGATLALPEVARAEQEQVVAQMMMLPSVEDLSEAELLEELINLTRRQRNILLQLESSSNSEVRGFAESMMGDTMSMLEQAEATERAFFANRMDSRR
ncbi:MAG: hypothetical protein HC838_11260 [Spirulinaceae cyanobacterium RM2_2_10]|nr:hypothetical protein [Spirulinaceae cyanobacterium SM2_1_0]NJO20493.1 hypothetical protein [Spirulinaceae cyanobacterium RM2_2_10]